MFYVLVCVVVLLSLLVLCVFFVLQYYFDFMCSIFCLFIIIVLACVLPWRINVFIISGMITESKLAYFKLAGLQDINYIMHICSENSQSNV